VIVSESIVTRTAGIWFSHCSATVSPSILHDCPLVISTESVISRNRAVLSTLIVALLNWDCIQQAPVDPSHLRSCARQQT
jgi:hypothetical protein